MISQKSYLIRAIYDWCVDNEFTPFLATHVDKKTVVPHQYVQDDQIILNLSPIATKDLEIDCEWITCKAVFGGNIMDIAVPIYNVIAIFAQENGQGMQFNIEIDDIDTSNNINDNESNEVSQNNSGLRLIK